jgi:hypothetical protein
MARAHGRVDGAGQGLGQRLAGRMELEQRVGHQAELVGHRLEFVGVSGGQRGPGFLGRGDALAGLRQQGRIETPELDEFVIHRLEAVQAVGRADADSTGVSLARAETACEQKNSRSWASRSETAVSPLASEAYCIRIREAARLT